VNDRHQVVALETRILKLTKEIARGLPDDFAPSGVSVIVRELVDSLEEFVGHRDADNGHIITQAD